MYKFWQIHVTNLEKSIWQCWQIQEIEQNSKEGLSVWLTDWLTRQENDWTRVTLPKKVIKWYKVLSKKCMRCQHSIWWKSTKWSWLALVTNEPSTSLAGKECVERTEECWHHNWVHALFLLATLYTSWTVWGLINIFLMVNKMVVKTDNIW